MALELYYTSSPRGLRPGTSGLCTVATSRSMSPALVSRLETLCGYRPPSDGTPQDRWPVALSHWVIDIGGVERHVLASVRPVAPDHTMRSNTLAHFAVLHNSELDAAGPAWMLSQPETSATAWSGEPRTIDAERAMPRGGPASVRKCATWQRVAGDAGWAGVLANAAMLDPSRPATVICPAGAPVLELVAEAMSLLPAAQRWGVTFTTYFTQPIAGLRCTWRFCLDGTSAAAAARQAGGLVIDVCAPQPCTRTGAFVDAARTGRTPELAPPADAAVPAPRRARTQDAAPVAFEAEGSAPSSRASRTVAALRAPVGIEEPEPTPARGRTMLTGALIVAALALAAVAVMAVLMHGMSLRAGEVDRELGAARAELDSARGDIDRAAELSAQVSSLQQQLTQAQQAATDAEQRARQASAEASALRIRLNAKSPAFEQPATPSGPAPPSGQAAPQEDADRTAQPQHTSAVDGSQVGAHGRGSAPQAGGVAWLPSVRPPSVAALKDTSAEIAWPEARATGVSDLTLSASAALRDAGFEIVDGRTLAMAEGDSAIPVGSVSVEGGTPTWTWRKDDRNLARSRLAALGVRLPDDVDVLMGQLEIKATLADGSVLRAVPASRRTQRWELDPLAASSIRVPIAALLGRAFVLELDGQQVEVHDGTKAAISHRGMGSVHVQLSSAGEGRSRELTVSWSPEGDCASLAACAQSVATLQERFAADDARWTAASAWHDALAASKPLASAAAVESSFTQWKQAEAAGMGDQAQRSRFLAAPKPELARRYVDSLWTARKASEDALAKAREDCATLSESVAAAMAEGTATVRTGGGGAEALAIVLAPRLPGPAVARSGAAQLRKGPAR